MNRLSIDHAVQIVAEECEGFHARLTTVTPFDFRISNDVQKAFQIVEWMEEKSRSIFPVQVKDSDHFLLVHIHNVTITIPPLHRSVKIDPTSRQRDAP